MSSQSLHNEIARKICLGAAMGVVALLASTAQAAYTLDRWYQMGDDILLKNTANAENAVNGQPVGSGNSLRYSDAQVTEGVPVTYDSAVRTGSPEEMNATFERLGAFGNNGLPTYVEYGVGGNPAAPVAGAVSMNRFGIRFDGVDDYLMGLNLNDPRIAPPGSTSVYPDTVNRGMQMWAMPTAVDGVRETIIDDADFHGFNIIPNGNWQSEVREAGQDTGVSALATQNQWTHLMMVHDTVKLGAVVSYVNGIAVASQATGYTADAITNLLVGANAESVASTTADPSTLDTPGFFSGIVDEIEMFVLDGPTTSSYGLFDYTRDNGYFTDVWLPQQSGYSFVLNSSTGHNSALWVKGDINFNGVLDAGDVEAFKDGWLFERADLPGAGPQMGDYSTLAKGDLNLDGKVNLADWVLLRQYNLDSLAGLTMPSLGQLGSPIPEPSSAIVLVLGSLAGWRLRRRWSRLA